MQDKDGVPPELHLYLFYWDGFVVTTYLDDKHNNFFLDGANMDYNTSAKTTVLFWFPYNSTGGELESFVNDKV